MVQSAAVPPVAPVQTIMTVCKKIAGPILAGGVALLPPASGVPGAGGVGGFPAGAPSEYGAPGFFGPGPYAGGPGSYLGPGGTYVPVGYGGFPGGGVIGPGPTSTSPTPVLFAQGPTDTPPAVPPVLPGSPSPALAVPTPTPTPTPTPVGPPLPTPISTPTPFPTPTPIATPTPAPTPPSIPGGAPGESTMTPEPATIGLLGGVVVLLVGWRFKRGRLGLS